MEFIKPIVVLTGITLIVMTIWPLIYPRSIKFLSMDYAVARHRLIAARDRVFWPGRPVKVLTDGKHCIYGFVHRLQGQEAAYLDVLLEHGEPRSFELNRVDPCDADQVGWATPISRKEFDDEYLCKPLGDCCD